METQPNFEKLKSLFYQTFLHSDKAHLTIAMQSIQNMDFRSHYTKFDEFKKDFNTWLNRIDIRQSGAVIDVLVENKKAFPSIPKWMQSKKYVIDYNKYDMLDLIPTNQQHGN